MKRTAILVLVAVAILAVNSAIAFAESGPVVRKEVWVTLTKNTEFGGTILKPGYYLVQDTVSGGTHWVSLRKAGDPDLALQYSDKAFEGDAVSETCSVQKLPRTSKKTKVVTVPEGANQRISVMEIKGEDVLHVF
jgi:hypothetical protein